MSRETTHEREALEALLQSDGWQYVRAYVAKEWVGPGFQARIAAALGKDDLLEAKIVHRVSIHMQQLLTAIENRVQELKGVSD